MTGDAGTRGIPSNTRGHGPAQRLCPAAGVLVLGYGNLLRRDDGLGLRCAALVSRLALPNVTVELAPQLLPEHAWVLAEHAVTLLVDAAAMGDEPFQLRRVVRSAATGTAPALCHRLEPDALFALASLLSGRWPAGYLLAVRGYDFDTVGEGISAAARQSLAAAVRVTIRLVRRWARAASRPGAPGALTSAGGASNEECHARR